MNAATPGATTLVPTTTAVELPAGLTDTDAARITAAISAARTESTPPLYYALAWLWAKLFGDGEVGLRSLSAIVGTLTVPLAYLTARQRLAATGALLTRHVGLTSGAEDPGASEAVRQVRTSRRRRCRL